MVIKKHIFSLIIIAAIISFFIACKKTPDKPHINPIPAGGFTTISALRTMFANNQGQNIKFTQDISLYATVTMTDNYKTLYIKDNTGAILVRQLTAHGIFAGDSLRINLNGSTLDLSGTASSLQIDSVDVSDSPTCKVVKLAVGKPITPITVSISQLNHSASSTTYSGLTGPFLVPYSIYDGQLVQLNDVQFSFASRSYFIRNTGAVYYSDTLYDCGGMNNIQVSLYAGTADFMNQKVPYQYSGSIVGVASFYNNLMQITPRSFADLKFNQPRCGVQTLTQTFDTAVFGTGATNFNTLFPGWYNQKQVGVNQLWLGTTQGTTYFPSASTYYSTDAHNVIWMITPPIQNSPTKNLLFNAATTYNTNSTQQLRIMISTDYNGYNLGGVSGVQFGTQAHWTDITSSFNNLNAIAASGASSFWTLSSANVVGGSATPVMLSTTAAGLPGGVLNNYTGTFYIGFRYQGNKVDSVGGFGVNNVIVKD